MAELKAVLTMTPSEEAALSRLLGFLCETESRDNMHGQLTRILGVDNKDIEKIGRINGALNATR